MAKISIIMPVYNSEKYLENAINSILNQNFQDFELILVDDGSKDNSGNICDKYDKLDERVKVIHKPNGGICEARNVGLKNAKGEYIMFSDNDDEYIQGALKENYNLVIETKADIVKFGRKAVYINSNNEIYKEDIRQFHQNVFTKEEVNENSIELFYNNTFTCVWDGIYRREILEKFDTFFKNGKEDIDYNIKLLKNIKKIALSDKVYYIHYIRQSFSTSTKYAEINIETTKELLSRFLKYLEENTIIEKKDYAKYNIYMIRNYFNSMLRILANRKCKISNKKKISLLKEINLQLNLKDTNFIKMWKISKIFMIEYLLIKFKLYKILILFGKLKLG